MRKFNLVFITTLLLTISTVFAQQTDDNLDDFNIPGVEKSLDELVGPEPEVSGIPSANEPIAQDTTPKPVEPLEVPGVEWARVSPERGGLSELSFEVPENWMRKDDIWTVKKGDDVETGLKVSLTKFKEEDLAKAAKSMPEFSSTKSTINGNVVIVISSKRVIKMAFYGAPMFTGKRQLMMTFSSANIKRDMPIFEHIMQTVNSGRKPQKTGETVNVASTPTSKGTTVKFVNTALGDGEGAVIAADGYYKASLPGYKGEVFFAASIDLNNDGKKEWFVQAREPANCYGTKDSCMTFYFGHGPDGKLVDLGYGRLASVAVLDSTTNGYLDLTFNGKLHSFNGSKYYSGKAKEVKRNSFVNAGPAEAEINKGVAPVQPSSRQTAQADQPTNDLGIKWRRTGLKKTSLKSVTIEIPDTWSLKDDGYMVTKDGKIGLGFMVQLEHFGEKDIKQMKREMKGYKEKKINVNGHLVRYFTGQSSWTEEVLDTVFTAFDTPKFGKGRTFGFAFVSADMKRDVSIFDHILHSVQFEKPKPIAQGIVPLKLERVEIGKAGELAGALAEIEKWGTRKDNVYSFVRVDLNNDGVKDAIIHVNQRFGYCKNFDANDGICRFIIMKLNENQEWDSIPSPRPIYAKNIGSLPSFTNGYRDLVFDNILYTYDGDQSYREGRQKEVTKKTPATNTVHPAAPSERNSLGKPAQSAKAANALDIEWVRVSSPKKELKGISFDVPKNWPRIGDFDTWTKETGSKIDVYLDVLLMRPKGMELAGTKAHLKKFASSKSVINGIPMEILTAKNKHGGVMYNESIVFFGKPVPFSRAKSP